MNKGKKIEKIIFLHDAKNDKIKKYIIISSIFFSLFLLKPLIEKNKGSAIKTTLTDKDTSQQTNDDNFTSSAIEIKSIRNNYFFTLKTQNVKSLSNIEKSYIFDGLDMDVVDLSSSEEYHIMSKYGSIRNNKHIYLEQDVFIESGDLKYNADRMYVDSITKNIISSNINITSFNKNGSTKLQSTSMKNDAENNKIHFLGNVKIDSYNTQTKMMDEVNCDNFLIDKISNELICSGNVVANLKNQKYKIKSNIMISKLLKENDKSTQASFKNAQIQSFKAIDGVYFTDGVVEARSSTGDYNPKTDILIMEKNVMVKNQNGATRCDKFIYNVKESKGEMIMNDTLSPIDNKLSEEPQSNEEETFIPEDKDKPTDYKILDIRQNYHLYKHCFASEVFDENNIEVEMENTATAECIKETSLNQINKAISNKIRITMKKGSPKKPPSD